MPLRTRTPLRPVGNDPQMDHIMQMLERAMQELQPYDSTDIGFTMTPRGFQAYLKNKTAGVSSEFPWQKPKELDPNVSVKKNTFVYISPNNPIVTAGIVDLVSGNLTLAQSGIWQAAQSVPAQVTVSSVVKYNVPAPLPVGAVTGTPLTGDADASTVFWIPWSAVTQCF